MIAISIVLTHVWSFSVAPSAGARGGQVVNSWQLSPTGADPNEPGGRPFLSYTLAPGASVNDSVTLWNYSNVELQFRVYATDAFNTEIGGFDLLTGDKKPVDLGAWVRMSFETVAVPPLSKLDIPFTLTLPTDARPGDHAAAILASSMGEGTDEQGKLVTVDRRTGSRMYLRVAGPESPALTVDSIYSVYHASPNPFGGSVDVTYTIRNTGNIRLAARQTVSLKSPLGNVMKQAKPEDVPELLPGAAITLKARFDGVAATFRVSAVVRLEPIPAAGTELSVAPMARSGGAWAVPWSVLAAIAVIMLLRRTVRRRRGDGEVTSPEPPTPDFASPSAR